MTPLSDGEIRRRWNLYVDETARACEQRPSPMPGYVLRSLIRLLDYVHHDEAKDFDVRDEPPDHIMRPIIELSSWVENSTPKAERDATKPYLPQQDPHAVRAATRSDAISKGEEASGHDYPAFQS
jgi:hypothetical protein